MELPPCWRKNLLSLISRSFFAHANNTAPSKPYAKILQHTNNETGWVRIVKKTGEKYHDTVPLRTISPTFLPVDILLLFHFLLPSTCSFFFHLVLPFPPTPPPLPSPFPPFPSPPPPRAANQTEKSPSVNTIISPYSPPSHLNSRVY